MRRATNANTQPNSYGDSNGDRFAFSYADEYGATNAYSYGNGYTYGDSYCNADCDADCDTNLSTANLAIGPSAASGSLCYPGRAWDGQHALYRWRSNRRRGADSLRTGVTL